MFPLLVAALRDWAVGKYCIQFENERDVSQLQYQSEELLAEIAERVNRTSKDILEDFGSSWFEEIAPKRYPWQLELLGLTPTELLSKGKTQTLSSLAASTGAWRNAVENLCSTLPTNVSFQFWWSELKHESLEGYELESGVFHFSEEGSQVNLFPFFVGLLRSIARIQKKTMEVKTIQRTNPNSCNELDPPTSTSSPISSEQEILVEWREICIIDNTLINSSSSSNPTVTTTLMHSRSLPTLPISSISTPTSCSHATTSSASSPPFLISPLSSPVSTSPTSPSFLLSRSEESIWQDRRPTPYFGLEADELSELFPFHMVLKGDDELRIVQLGTLLAQALPKLQGNNFLSQMNHVTTTSHYGEVITFDPLSDPIAANKFQLSNIQFMNVVLKTGVALRGKVKERRRRNAQPLYFFFAKPTIPSLRTRGRNSQIHGSSSPTSLRDLNRSNSDSSISNIARQQSLGLSIPVVQNVAEKSVLACDELIEDLMMREVSRAVFNNTTSKRNYHLHRSRSGSRSSSSSSSSKKGHDNRSDKRKNKSRKKERSHGESSSSYEKHDKDKGLRTSSDTIENTSGGEVQKQLMEYSKALHAEIAERKSLEKQLATARIEATAESRATSAFLAHMSHEIRTPLNGILGMSQLLLDSNLDTQQRDTAETIQTSGQQLLTIVNDILDFEKIQAGCLTLEFISFDLRKVVEESCEMLSFQSNSKALETIIHFSRELPRWVKGDPGRLRQILLNFLNNAIKFTEHGHIRVICNVANGLREDDSMVHLQVTVEDTGIGIPEDRLSRLFKSFSQVDSSITRKYGGTGLGLVISQQLVELMGGSEISVESKVGVGSAFTFVIPLRLDKETEDGRPSLKGRVFCVIEHNETLRRALTEDLMRFDLDVVTASTIQEAEERQRQHKISLIFSTSEVARAPMWLEFLEKSARKCAVVVLHSPFARMDSELGNKPFITLSKPIKMRELEYIIMSELGLLSEEAKQMISGRRRKSIKLSRKFSMGGYSVLLVDDNAVNLKVASRLLERLCIKPDCVCSGQEALECAKRKQYDVILMDLCMPGMNGYEATAELRNLEKLTQAPRACKVIAITADATTDDRSKCLTSGMDDFVSKPLTLEKLADVLDRTLFSDSDSPLPSGVEAELLERIPFSECM